VYYSHHVKQHGKAPWCVLLEPARYELTRFCAGTTKQHGMEVDKRKTGGAGADEEGWVAGPLPMEGEAGGGASGPVPLSEPLTSRVSQWRRRAAWAQVGIVQRRSTSGASASSLGTCVSVCTGGC